MLLFRWKGAAPWPSISTELDEATVAAQVEVFLVQRKDSIGFVELLRGKFKLAEKEYIQGLLAGTTMAERQRLRERPFDTLWEELWGAPQETGNSYKAEKEIARQKFEAFRPELVARLADLSGAWATPEWGIPKGRKELHETEYACAMREMWEETNISEKDVLPLRNLEPVKEVFEGSNGVTYCHKYFLAYVPPGVGEAPFADAAAENPHIQREIGDYRWCSLEEAAGLFRPEHKERAQLLRRVQQLLSRVVCVPVSMGGRRV